MVTLTEQKLWGNLTLIVREESCMGVSCTYCPLARFYLDDRHPFCSYESSDDVRLIQRAKGILESFSPAEVTLWLL